MSDESKKAAATGTPSRVSDTDLRRDPAAVLRAAHDRPVVVTGRSGEPLMTISSPIVPRDDFDGWQ